MNISGIRPYEGFYEYSPVNDDKVKEQSSELFTGASVQQQNTKDQPSVEQNYTSYDYAQKFEPGITYDMKGADSELASLDVEQAISLMKKDQVIQQYQFFVGEGAAQKKLESSHVPAREVENFSI